MKVSYAIVRAGTVAATGHFCTLHDDPQPVADAILAWPAAQDCDEVRVWIGDTTTGQPHAVARRNGGAS